MLKEWISRYSPQRTFLSSQQGSVTYGDLRGAFRVGEDDQAIVTPGADLASVVDLMAGRQTVVVDPRLPAGERQRRITLAREAVGREAATILFTSGTSGPAKAVRLTEANWQAAVEASASHLDHGPDDVWLAAMPLHHVGGLAILFRSAFAGGSVHWLPQFRVAEVVARLRSEVTMASLVPTMLRRVLDYDSEGFDGLRAVLVGGGPIPAGLLEEAHQRGIPALPTYGMTETCAQVATRRPGAPPRRAAHVLPGVEGRIGQDERIELRGDQISPGYADEDDRPPGSWFVTPDRGRLLEDGALQVLGRADDVIVTGGENVDPQTVEAVLAGHPEVVSAAVVGIPDPEWGRRLVAVYEGTVASEELHAWAGTRLAPHEVPKTMHRLDAIPVGGGGKPDRAEIRRRLK